MFQWNLKLILVGITYYPVCWTDSVPRLTGIVFLSFRGEFILTFTPFTLALLIRSETGFAPMRAFTLHQLIRISDFNRIKLNHLLEVVSHRTGLVYSGF